MSFFNNAPAPAAGGFSFGSPAASTSIPAPAGAPAPAPAQGFFLGGSTPAPAAPAPTGYSGALVTTSTAPPHQQQQQQQQPSATLQVPDFDSVFGNLELWSQVQKLCQQDTVLAGQEWRHWISTTNWKPQLVEWTAPNPTLRQQLAAQPTVALLHNNDSGSASTSTSTSTSTTALTPKVLERVLDLATDLRISEAHAIALYAEVARDPEAFRGLTRNTFVEQAIPSKKYTPLLKLVRDFYFHERHLRLQTLLFLVQSRMSASKLRLEATDQLIQDGLAMDLLAVVRDYTQRIQQLQHELAAQKETNQPYAAAAVFTAAAAKPPSSFSQVHLLFCQLERHVAAETLFFLAYHTQLTTHEMASLMDLIRDLSAMTPRPCPFTNVPSPYEPISTGTTPSASATTAYSSTAPFSYALQEKAPLVWQREFVAETHQSGQPQLVQCISLLVVTAMAAMDTRQVLYDRQLHGPNAFGKGNQFLPPDNPSLDGITELHSRLNPQACSQWVRQDIWGVLAASYALLLRSAPTLLSSPRAAGSSQLSMDIRQAARTCLELPVDLKSFTFCRLTLIPALQRSPRTSDENNFCNVSEFGLSVLSETYAHYLHVLVEGPLPISRQRWEKEEDEELNLRRAQQVQQKQFYAWSGNNTATEEAIPAAVDLMTRPDCLDDIIALATLLCSLGPEYSRNFWTREETTGSLIPHRTLQELELIQTKDDSLLPSYLSWLAALVNDEASANAVHEILSRVEDDGTSNRRAKVTWTTLIFNLRWYAQELSPYDANVVSKPTTTNNNTTTTKSSSYYYNLEGNAIPTTSGSNSSTHHQNTHPGGVGETSSSTATSSTTSSSTGGKPKELSDLARFRLASHLAVIMNVAMHSSTAQHAILSISLPVGDASSIMAGGDETLLVLFKLAIAPLSPQVRGATLSTIANLLRSSRQNNNEFLQEQAKHAWEYLESCPLLPMALLDQYLLNNNNVAVEAARAGVGLAFPPSSTALANSGGNSTKSILPKDPNYGLIYEMEHVESRLGWYPSTEGFLQLLTSLVCAVGCPKTLGQNWRIRTGCAPYLEYVVDCVLPRVLGINDYPPLPFRVKGDQSRLVSRALSVVEAIVTRYSVPTKALKLKGGPASALSLLGIQSVVDQVLVVPTIAVDGKELVDDYKNMSISSYQPSDAASTSNSGTATSGLSIPCTKSPGFSILADILSSAGGIIFQALTKVLTDHGGPRGIASAFGSQADSMALAYALFGAVPPNMTSAKEGSKEGGPSKPLQTLLKPISPEIQMSIMDMTKFDDAVSWREDSIVVALRILCAAAAQEESFIAAVSSAKEPLKIVPVLRFQHIRYGSSNFRVVDVNLSRLTNLLFSANNAQYIRSSIVEYIGYSASSEQHQADLAAFALSMVFFMHQTMSPSYSLRALCGNEPEKMLSQAVARRLLASSKRLGSSTDTQTVNLILNWILSDLRLGKVTNDGVVQVLLGLPSATLGGNWKPRRKQYSGSLDDCFDAILDLLKDVDYVTSSSSSGIASFCLEILFRLYDLLQCGDSTSLRIVLYAAERLRSLDFWKTNVLVWLSERGLSPLLRASSVDFKDADPDILNCVAWLLKGLACELKLLVGFANNATLESEMGLAGLLAPRPLQCKFLLSLLFGSDEAIAYKLIEQLPLNRVSLDALLTHPPLEALRAAVFGLPGPADVVGGYEQVNGAKVTQAIRSQHSAEELDSMRQWADQWNTSAAWDCAASHLSNATYFVLDAALYSSESLRSNGASALGGLGSSQIFGLQANGLTDLLALILRRLYIEACQARHHGMDAKLLPAATRNLSNAALLLSENIIGFDKREAPSAADLLTVASLLSRALAFSSVGDDSAVEAPTRYERTTVLSSALSLLLRHTSDVEPGFVRQYREDFLPAAQALEKLSCFKVDAKSSESLGVVSILARATFGSLVVACSDEDDTREQSFVFNCMSKTFVKPLLELVANLDENVCYLLQTVALQRYGAEILINFGICDALKAAAKTYIAEEERVKSRLKGTGASYNKVTLGTPHFLLSHLKLLSALMASTCLPEKQSTELAISSLEIIGLHKGIVQRLCYNFPAEADVLRCFMRCFVQALSLAQPVNVNERHDMLSDHSFKLKQIFSEALFIENGILLLCQQLWENPLSRDLLPSLPPALKDSGTSVESSVVSIEKDQRQSWWDVLDSILAIKAGDSRYSFNAPVGSNDFGYWGNKSQKKWNENKFEYSIVATDILSLGLSLLKRLNRFEMLDGSSIARGLFNCSFAAQTVESRLEEVRSQVGNAANVMETDDSGSGNIELEAEYLTLLGKSLARCVEELLVVSYMVVGGAKENGRNDVMKQIRTAIEQSGLDTKGVGCLSMMNDGAKRQELVSHLCSQIKKEIS